ncbi:hypothetical protein [Nocardia sp. NBC_01327]|uniref:hypothetical protein n=1 Tax=Nocardia sp. NBC_01327 TaxID=2903593 RepID=UPI002E0FE44F|nr:hypothetical protein OG326_17835 [Nocardia sp. NBC_01327]
MGTTAPMTYVIDVSGEIGVAGDRDTIGGWPVLDADQPWPLCDCGARMALYFQVEVPAGVPHFGGDQLLVFQCPAESDACYPSETQLPAEYWDHPAENDHAFWRILLQRNGVPVDAADPYLQPHRLVVRGFEDADHGNDSLPLQDFKVGGAAFWVQAAEHFRCACGTDLVFLCQVPENFDFSAYLRDPDIDLPAFDDGLLLGNIVYILACPAHCHPAAAYPVCQN